MLTYFTWTLNNSFNSNSNLPSINSQVFDQKRNLTRHFLGCISIAIQKHFNLHNLLLAKEILAHVNKTPREVMKVPRQDEFCGLTTVSDKFFSCVFSRLANENIKMNSKQENNFFLPKVIVEERKCFWFFLFHLNFNISCNDDSHFLSCGFWHFFSPLRFWRDFGGECFEIIGRRNLLVWEEIGCPKGRCWWKKINKISELVNKRRKLLLAPPVYCNENALEHFDFDELPAFLLKLEL